jgi:hypothetical protein
MMSYLKVRHRCPLPLINGQGDIWQCDECGKIWRSIYAGWRRLGPLGPLGRLIYTTGKPPADDSLPPDFEHPSASLDPPSAAVRLPPHTDP